MSDSEFAVLATVALHDGRLVTRQTLVARLGGDEGIDATRRLKDTIKRLRAKLCVLDLDASIVAVRGLGYRYARPSRL